MGAIHFSVDVELIEALRRRLPLSVFLETGTYKGETTLAAARHFPRVITVELSPEMYEFAAGRLDALHNVERILGSSPDTLRRLSPMLGTQSVVYWLDAHWCGEATAGAAAECPLLDELDAIGTLNDRSVILIDDARLFLAPPPAPHQVSQWPQLSDITRALDRLSAVHRLWVINDVLVFAPETVAAEVVAYGREFGVDLEKVFRAAMQVSRANEAMEADPHTSESSVIAKSLPPGASLPAWNGLNASVAVAGRSERLFVEHLLRLGISRVLDIGSNTGQFVEKLRALGYPGTVFSVEPQSACYGQLLQNARPDPRWVVLPRQGVGAERGYLKLNVAENSYSSSLLNVHANHLEAERTTRTVAVEQVFVNRATGLLREEVLDTVEAMKIDVQGFERQVLEGFRPHLTHVRLLLVELSMVECYVGAPDLFALDAWIVEELGFERVSLEPAYYDESNAVVQQYDGIYRRADPGRRAADQLAPVCIDAVVTSIGGTFSRIGPAGADVGPEWFRNCVSTWTSVAPKTISVSEVAPKAPGVVWVRAERKPSLGEVFRAIETNAARSVLLTNADIALTDGMRILVPNLDPAVVYFGHRVDVELAPSGPGDLVGKGLYPWGFDFFVLPAEFVRDVNREGAFPDFFIVGEPWWDYFLPMLALARGFPLKRIQGPDPLALHYAHEPKYSNQLWVENGERFLGGLVVLRSAPSCPIEGLIDEILAAPGQETDRVRRLERVSEFVCSILP